MEQQVWSLQRARRSTLRPRVAVPPSHGAFQGHAAHLAEWSATLRPKGSSSTCIPEGVSTFFHTAFTAHSDVGAEAVGSQLQGIVRP
jgi:L-ascorbate metabolism protein UlaG (beta-lactamase superfamily)